MPIYEYRCGSCGFEKEYLQKLSDAPITDCPTCGKPEMIKLVSAAGFQLKGTGWYVTDYARADGKKKGAKDGEGKSETKSDAGASTSETKSDASKSESKTKSSTGSRTPAATAS